LIEGGFALLAREVVEWNYMDMMRVPVCLLLHRIIHYAIERADNLYVGNGATVYFLVSHTVLISGSTERHHGVHKKRIYLKIFGEQCLI
jgi:hypothetical protein